MENSGSQTSTESELSSASEEPNGQVHYVSDSANLANGSVLTSQIENSISQLRFATSSVYCKKFLLKIQIIMLNNSFVYSFAYFVEILHPMIN